MSVLSSLAKVPKRIFGEKTVVRILSGPLRGAKWVMGASVQKCWLGIYERDRLEGLKSFLKRGDVFYDIGAQAGYHSLLASLCVGGQGAVYAFEPLPRNQQYLTTIMSINEVFNVELVRAAVSDTAGEKSFDLTTSFMAGRLSNQGTERVPCVTIDGWAASHRPPTCMKIDVEGAELDVLQGGRNTLAAHKPALIIDTHDFLGGSCTGIHEACCDFLRSIGYESIETTPPDGFAALIVAR